MIKDISDIDTNAEFNICGEAYFEAGEYETGTADHWTANVYGLNVWINGKEYTIPGKAMPPELIQALEQAATDELEKYY